ncbi:37776_t:CDS:2 [Gigaspora margarita]|uniref:37776_t:CDS:1 n=1 Tax=Gigaspora margarita TaxID=4874 RepID=A0ABN7VEB5_GIGMA|nr:37776_t:CDS:2 [Gigaspora margarita]
MVLCYLERINNVKATMKHFEIEPKQVYNWCDKKQELLNSAPYVLTLNCEQQAHRNRGLEDNLVFDYELLDEINTNNKPLEEVLNLDNIDGDEYKEVEFNNI